MKTYPTFFTAMSLLALPAFGQVTVVPATPITPGATVTTPAPSSVQVQSTVTPGVTTQPRTVIVERPAGSSGLVINRTIDTTVARQQLSVAPRVVVTTPGVVTTTTTAPPRAVEVAPPSRTVTETTSTTVERDARGRPHRVYNVDRNIVIVKEADQTRELPYVTVPVLFVQGTADLLDDQSAAALQQMAGVILEVASTNPNARFDVEGHTSTEGADDMNLNLSVARAQRVYDELTQRYSVPPATLSAHGYGETFPAYPNGTEAQLQLDRRVLVVRTN